MWSDPVCGHGRLYKTTHRCLKSRIHLSQISQGTVKSLSWHFVVPQALCSWQNLQCLLAYCPSPPLSQISWSLSLPTETGDKSQCQIRSGSHKAEQQWAAAAKFVVPRWTHRGPADNNYTAFTISFMWHVILIHHLTPSGTGSPLHISPATLKSETNGSIRKEKQQTNEKIIACSERRPKMHTEIFKNSIAQTVSFLS